MRSGAESQASGSPVPEQSMRFAFVDPETITSAGFHVAVFLALVVVLLAIQWLLDKRQR